MPSDAKQTLWPMGKGQSSGRGSLEPMSWQEQPPDRLERLAEGSGLPSSGPCLRSPGWELPCPQPATHFLFLSLRAFPF